MVIKISTSIFEAAMFEFEAKFLLKKGFRTQGSRIPYTFSRHAREVMVGQEVNPDGTRKYHTNGEVTEKIVVEALTGFVDIVYPVREKGERQAEILAMGKASDNLYTHAPGDPRRQKRPIGSPIPLDCPIRLTPYAALITTVYPLTEKDYNLAIEKDQIPLSEWVKICQTETGKVWAINDLEKTEEELRLKKEKEKQQAEKQLNLEKQQAARRKARKTEIDRLQTQLNRLEVEAKRGHPKPRLLELAEKIQNSKNKLVALKEEDEWQQLLDEEENSKISCVISSKIGYNSVSGANMRINGNLLQLVTREELVEEMRNDGMTEEEIEAYFVKYGFDE